MKDDNALLTRFAATRDEASFAELVGRHLNWVYSVALRRLNGDAHLAQDAAQLVFTQLAQQAATVARHPTPAGWLFRTIHHTTAKLARTEQRRRTRERTAMSLQEADNPSPAADWNQIRPLVDDALAELKDADRTAVLLRFYENRDYASIGDRLNLTANAARMRVDRALDHLNAALTRRGVTSTTGALATVLGAHTVGASPAGLIASVTSTALAGSVATFGTGAAVFTMVKIPLTVTAAVLALGSATLAVQSHTAADSAAPLPVPIAHQPPSPPPSKPSPATPAPATVQLDQAYSALEQEASTLSQRLAEVDAATARALRGAATPGKVHEVKELDVAPVPNSQPLPVYPFGLRQSGMQGEAVLSFVVDANGTARDLRTVSATREEFAQAAHTAVAAWKFDPGRIADKAVNTRMQVPIRFTIVNPPPGEPLQVDEWF